MDNPPSIITPSGNKLFPAEQEIAPMPVAKLAQRPKIVGRKYFQRAKAALTFFDKTDLSLCPSEGKTLIQGDNLAALQFLKQVAEAAGKVSLVYIDPPFATGNDFLVNGKRTATISRSNNGVLAYGDKFSREGYLDFLKPRLEAIRELMAEDSSIYVHIDCKIGHYVKCLMDEVFGDEHFVNDITRIKCNPKNFSRAAYGNVKDMILFYRKSTQYIWNDLKQAIDISSDLRFRSVDAKGRRYTTTPLHAPGETSNGATGKPWRGIRPPAGRHWRYAPKALEELERKGLIEWSSTGNPRKKLYADEVEKAGVKIQDVWMFKDPQHSKYPTEKNLDMIKMIVSNSSRPGGIVLDAFCGSGTTLVAAEELGRRWIGIDSSRIAISTCRERLAKSKFAFIPLEEKQRVILCERNRIKPFLYWALKFDAAN